MKSLSVPAYEKKKKRVNQIKGPEEKRSEKNRERMMAREKNP